jgi:hypothetical protein
MDIVPKSTMKELYLHTSHAFMASPLGTYNSGRLETRDMTIKEQFANTYAPAQKVDMHEKKKGMSSLQ